MVFVNKMDLVDYSEEIFDDIVAQFEEIPSKMLVKDVHFIPISALNRDNLVNQSKNMDWYKGTPMLHVLETMHISSDINKVDARFPVQTVIRPQSESHRGYRGYAGRVASGVFRVGDDITVMPSGFTSKIKSIDLMDAELNAAHAPQSV